MLLVVVVQTAHLAVSDATFKYTHFFAYGFLYAFESIFKVLLPGPVSPQGAGQPLLTLACCCCGGGGLQGYPVPNEWKLLFEAAAKSAQLDPDQIRADAAK